VFIAFAAFYVIMTTVALSAANIAARVHDPLRQRAPGERAPAGDDGVASAQDSHARRPRASLASRLTAASVSRAAVLRSMSGVTRIGSPKTTSQAAPAPPT